MGWREADVLRDRLERHPIYAEVQDLNRLRLFMAHHVFAVWDFMSLVKSVQGHTAPTAVPWMPTRRPPGLRRFINAVEALKNVNGCCRRRGFAGGEDAPLRPRRTLALYGGSHRDEARSVD